MEGERRRSMFFGGSKKRTRVIVRSQQSSIRRRSSRQKGLQSGVSVYLSKMYFIKDDLIRVTYAPESGDKSCGCYDEEGNDIIPFRGCP